ncbi:MAG: nucleoside-diphosphate kinase [Candidatus Riflemargulisbacteria bacterium]
MKLKLVSTTLINSKNPQSPYLFLKPNLWGNIKAQEEVISFLRNYGITVNNRIEIPGGTQFTEIIDEHYRNNSQSSVLSPNQLELDNDEKIKISSNFNLGWDSQIASGNIYNGFELIKKFRISPVDLNELWMKAQTIKVKSGLYLAKLELNGKTLFVTNGFYPAIQTKYTNINSGIIALNIKLPKNMSWNDFRELIGSTDPNKAKIGTLRKHLLDVASNLNITVTVLDNAVHASASPFEALREVSLWGKFLNKNYKSEPLYKALIENGINEQIIRVWFDNPLILYEDKQIRIFDILENLDFQETIDYLKKLLNI